jgi:excisionase family DNA binding protein
MNRKGMRDMQNIIQADKVYTVKEIALLIRRSYKTTLKLIKEGKIQVINDGARGYRISKGALFKYLGYIVEEERPETTHSKKKKRKSHL